MRYLIIVLSLFIITCGGGGGSPTEPTPPQLPTVQNIEFTTPEDTPKTFAFMGSEPQNYALTYTISTQPQHGTVSMSGGAATYTPNANYNGADTFYYLATSVSGNSNIGTVVVTITAVDDEPNTMDATVITDEDNAVDITLSAEEYDGDNIQFNVVNNPSNGSVTISGTTATYTPNQDWYGTDSFNFEAVDVSSKAILNTATATITVNPVNDAPTVENVDDIEAMKTQSIEIDLVGNDVEGDNLTFSIVDNPSKGTIESINNGVVTYNPTSIGNDSFTYKANDGTDDSQNTGTVSIYIDYYNVLYGSTSQNDYGMFIEQTSDNQYAIAVTSNSGAGYKTKIIKIDDDLAVTMEGNIIANNFYAESLRQTSDGEFIIAGTDYSHSSARMYLVKTSVDGNLLWGRTFYESGGPPSVGYHAEETSDGGYIITGYTEISSAGLKGTYVIKTDNEGIIGNTEWAQINSKHGYYDRGFEVYETSDGGFIVGGHSSSPSLGYYFMHLIKYDSSGNELWSQDFNQAEGYGHSLKITPDGGFIIAGREDTNLDTALIRKTDSSGNEEWSLLFDDYYQQKFLHIELVSDGGFIAVGSAVNLNSSGGQNYDMYVVKIDASGSIVWSQKFGNPHGSDGATGVVETANGDFIVCGTKRNDSNTSDVWLVKIGKDGDRIY